MRWFLALAAAWPLSAFADSETLPAGQGPAPHVATIASPNWLELPTAGQLDAGYPRGALRRGVSGRAVMNCVVTEEGTLSACSVISEDPPDMGFGEAVLALSDKFRMAPTLPDGRSVAGARVTIPMLFTVH
jgi:protein TonB